MKLGIATALAMTLAAPFVVAAVPASAQSAAEVRGSARDLGREKQDLRQARRTGDIDDVRDERHDVVDARQELRGDWYDYRRAHPNVYRVSPYVAPRGYVYRPVAVGYRFPSVYVSSRYWVNNWRVYRLPAPCAGCRWIRYGNDVVLVKTSTRAVVVVHRSFFY